MNKYLLQIWQCDNKNSRDDWSLEYHIITDPQEILERLKKFKEFNPKWYVWKPAIYSIKEVNLGVKVLSEDIKSFMGVGTIWAQINSELNENY